MWARKVERSVGRNREVRLVRRRPVVRKVLREGQGSRARAWKKGWRKGRWNERPLKD